MLMCANDAGVLMLLLLWCGSSEANARTCGGCRRGGGDVPPEMAAARRRTLREGNGGTCADVRHSVRGSASWHVGVRWLSAGAGDAAGA